MKKPFYQPILMYSSIQWSREMPRHQMCIKYALKNIKINHRHWPAPLDRLQESQLLCSASTTEHSSAPPPEQNCTHTGPRPRRTTSYCARTQNDQLQWNSQCHEELANSPEELELFCSSVEEMIRWMCRQGVGSQAPPPPKAPNWFKIKTNT